MTTYLGINTDTQRCCIIESISPVEVHYTSEDWGGSASIETTLVKRNLTTVGSITKLDHPVTITGEDFDMGHTYKWAFTFDSIQKVKHPYEL